MSEHNKNIYGRLSFIDILSNGLVVLSSYSFHKYQYEHALLNNDIYYIENDRHHELILYDVFMLHARSVTNIYVNLNMHHIFDESYHILIISSAVFMLCSTIIDFIYDFNIRNSMIISSKSITVLNICINVPTGYGIIMSLYNVTNPYYHGITYLYVFILCLIIFVQPFYKANQIAIHLVVCLVNYQLVLNNCSSIENSKFIGE